MSSEERARALVTAVFQHVTVTPRATGGIDVTYSDVDAVRIVDAAFRALEAERDDLQRENVSLANGLADLRRDLDAAKIELDGLTGAYTLATRANGDLQQQLQHYRALWEARGRARVNDLRAAGLSGPDLE